MVTNLGQLLKKAIAMNPTSDSYILVIQDVQDASKDFKIPSKHAKELYLRGYLAWDEINCCYTAQESTNI